MSGSHAHTLAAYRDQPNASSWLWLRHSGMTMMAASGGRVDRISKTRYRAARAGGCARRKENSAGQCPVIRRPAGGYCRPAGGRIPIGRSGRKNSSGGDLEGRRRRPHVLISARETTCLPCPALPCPAPVRESEGPKRVRGGEGRKREGRSWHTPYLPRSLIVAGGVPDPTMQAPRRQRHGGDHPHRQAPATPHAPSRPR